MSQTIYSEFFCNFLPVTLQFSLFTDFSQLIGNRLTLVRYTLVPMAEIKLIFTADVVIAVIRSFRETDSRWFVIPSDACASLISRASFERIVVLSEPNESHTLQFIVRLHPFPFHIKVFTYCP